MRRETREHGWRLLGWRLRAEQWWRLPGRRLPAQCEHDRGLQVPQRAQLGGLDDVRVSLPVRVQARTGGQGEEGGPEDGG